MRRAAQRLAQQAWRSLAADGLPPAAAQVRGACSCKLSLPRSSIQASHHSPSTRTATGSV